jgi:hypothetical protein
LLYDFLSGNLPISLIILGFVGAWAYRSRSSIRLAVRDERAFWAVVAKVGIFSTVLLFLWVTALDNWRQLLGYVVITGREYAADPFERAATPETLRMVTIALFVVSIVSLAMLYARHMGSYVFLVLAAIFAPIVMFTFNEIRISADAFLRLSERALENPSLLDAGAIVFWSIGMFVIVSVVVMATYFTFFSLLAIPLRIAYGLLAAPKQEELARVFESYERRARSSRMKDQQPGADQRLSNGDAPAKPSA